MYDSNSWEEFNAVNQEWSWKLNILFNYFMGGERRNTETDTEASFVSVDCLLSFSFFYCVQASVYSHFKRAKK